jgi:anti-sigma B factor antagonist
MADEETPKRSSPRSSPELKADTERLEDGTYIVAVTGEVDICTAPGLDQVLRGVLGDAATAVVVDLTECSFIDSTGLHVVLGAHKRLEGSGRPLSLVSCNRHVLKVLDLTGIAAMVDVYPSRAAALAGNGGG